MDNIVSVLQEWALNQSGNFVFWAPIVLVLAALFFAWALPAFKGFRILGWSLAIISALSAILTWTTVWDWRADAYTEEFQETLSEGIVLDGDTVGADRVSADAFGVVNVDMSFNYDLGYSDVFMIKDVEDFIDYLVLEYRVSEDSTEPYLETMRGFQELHVHISADGADIDDILSYHKDTLMNYADNVSLREETSDGSNTAPHESVADTDYRVLRGGDTESPWNMRDQQGSDGGVTLGQWAILDEAPNALREINNFSCSVLNGFDYCSEEPAEGDVGPPANHHSIILAGILLVAVIIIGSILDVIIRKVFPRIAPSRSDNNRTIGYGKSEQSDTEGYTPRHGTNTKENVKKTLPRL